MTNVSPHALKTITDGGDLLIFLWEHLDAKEPRVGVSAYVAEFFGELIYTIADGGTFNPGHIEMDSMFDFDADPDRWPLFGTRVLNFTGNMLQFAWEQGLTSVPPTRAVEAMVDYFDEGEVELRYCRDENGWWLESLPSFEQRFGAAVRVQLPAQPYRGNWHLTEVVSEREAAVQKTIEKLELKLQDEEFWLDK